MELAKIAARAARVATGEAYSTRACTLTLTACTFSSNTAGAAHARALGANVGIGGNGGGIYSSGAVTLDTRTFSANNAGTGGYGGGIYSSGALTLDTSTLSANNAGPADMAEASTAVARSQTDGLHLECQRGRLWRGNFQQRCRGFCRAPQFVDCTELGRE